MRKGEKAINIEVDEDLWKAVSKRCIDLELQKKDFMSMALVMLLRAEAKIVRKLMQEHKEKMTR